MIDIRARPERTGRNRRAHAVRNRIKPRIEKTRRTESGFKYLLSPPLFVSGFRYWWNADVRRRFLGRRIMAATRGLVSVESHSAFTDVNDWLAKTTLFGHLRKPLAVLCEKR